MKTLSEKLRNHIGKKWLCDIHKKKSTVTLQWVVARVEGNKIAVCHDCRDDIISRGYTFTNI